MNQNGFSGHSELRDIFNNELNMHGYSFQYAVLKAAEEAYASKESRWIFEASEFPVEAKEKDARIDFILKDGDYFLVAECKRVNPAYGTWCFVRAPIVRRNQSIEQFTIECLRRSKYEDPLKAGAHGRPISCDKGYYHIGIPVKNNKVKGNGGTNNNDAIEKAASQVCRGVSGLIQLAMTTKDLVMFQKGFIPTIFTTAKLWVSNSDLSESSLAEGNIDLSCSDFEEKPWVLYQYHVTPGIKHSVESDQSSKDLADMLWLAYSRTIPIVNANHVKEFLSWLRAGEFFSHPY